MARLQRKKTDEQKKKKRLKSERADDNSSTVENKGQANAREEKLKKYIEAQKNKPAQKTAQDEKESAVTRLVQFVREVQAELKKVTWPTREQTTTSTVVVIVLVAIIALFLGLADFGLTSLVQLVL